MCSLLDQPLTRALKNPEGHSSAAPTYVSERAPVVLKSSNMVPCRPEMMAGIIA